MRYIVMHKVDAAMESGTPPDREIVKRMGALVGDSLRRKVFLDGAGLHRSARRARLRGRGADRVVERGPYAGDNELVARLALIQTESIDAAIEIAGRFAAALGDAEVEIGPVVEPWDLTGAAKPADVTRERFLLLVKGDEAYERGASDPSREAAVARLSEELARDGVLVGHHHLAPSATGARLARTAGKARTWTDGPFAESKELIAGFSILALPSRAEAIAWADRYAEILADSEVDVRELVG